MKTKLLSMLIALLISMSFIACKKEGPTPERTTQEKIAGKWKLQSTVTNGFFSGSSHVYTYTGTAADYADFRNDGKVYSFVDNSYDTAAYGIISDTKMWIDNSSDVFDILSLTDATLKIYRKEIYNATEFYETTTTLGR